MTQAQSWWAYVHPGVDSRLVNKYDLFVLEAVQAWIDPKQPNPKAIHHRGYSKFVVDGSVIKLKSKMR